MTTTETTADSRRERKLDQIRKLLDKAADRGATEAESEALRQKADDLMLAYTVSEFEVESRKPKDQQQVPTRKSVSVCGKGNPIKQQLIDLMDDVACHARCKAVFHGTRDQREPCTATVVGFPGDVEYVEMLFTSLYVQMSRDLEPHYDAALSEEENLVAMKESGMKWERIHELLHPNLPWERRHGVRYTGIYTKYCERTGRKRMYTGPDVYQRNFSMGFVSEVDRRLREIAAHQQQAGTAGSGMELVVRDKVKDAFQEMFPKLSIMKATKTKLDFSAMGQGQAAGTRADLGQSRMAPRKELE